MSKVTIDGFDDALVERLRARANVHGCSLDKEVLDILRKETGTAAPSRRPKDLYAFIRACVEPLGGMEIDLPPRDMPPDPPKFG